MVAEEIKKLRQITDALIRNDYLIDQTKEWEYVLDALPDAVFIIDCDYVLKFANKKLSLLLKMERASFIGKNCYDVISSLDPSLCEISCCRSKLNISETHYFKNIKGWFNITKTPIYSSTNKLLGFICLLKDVTEIELKKRELAVSEKKYRVLVNNAPVCICEIDFKTFRLKSFNDLLCHYTNYSSEELRSIDIKKLLTKESLDIFLKKIHLVSEEQKSVSVLELELVRKDGTVRWVKLHPAFKFNDVGMPIGAQVVIFDIHEEKKAKLELEKRDRLLDSIYRSTPGGICVVSYPERIILWANEKIHDVLGYTKEELIGKNTRMLYFSEEDYQILNDFYTKFLNDPMNARGLYKVRLKNKLGEAVVVLLLSSKIVGEEGRVIFNIIDLNSICGYMETEVDNILLTN